MKHRVERIAGEVMQVNSYLVHGSEGIVVVDGMLTVSDARRVRSAIDSSFSPLAGVLVTHPHPDHYAGLREIVGDDDVPIVALESVAEVIRSDDEEKDRIVAPMMGAEWPSERIFPGVTVTDGAAVELGGLTFLVQELGPGESKADSMWWLDDKTVFAGDLVYNGMHCYLADGQWEAWLASIDRVERDLAPGVLLHVGHGEPVTKRHLPVQRRYIERFVAALQDNAADAAAGDRAAVLSAVREVVPGDELLFLAEVSVDPMRAALAGVPAR